MTLAQLETLARTSNPRKLSVRDFGMALAGGESGGTTVAGTLLVAEQAGIRVFATGGIGGVHRGSGFDISADLPQLASSPVVVVCAGAKAILDLPATLEYLETVGVPVVGYSTDEFPAFYARSSGLPLTMRADTPQEVASIAKAHWAMGNRSALLLTVPAPEESALPYAEIQVAIDQALAEAEAKHIQGQAVTPFLLQRVSEISGGESLQANLALLLNNAHVAAQVAKALTE
jgi:pseudouridine-5'-phosphate glycosidase